MFYVPEYGYLEYFLTIMGVGLTARIFYDEYSGTNNAPYSKFEKVANQAPAVLKLPTRISMLIIYVPAFFVILWWMQKYSTSKGYDREFCLQFSLLFHFAKRTLECAFLHKYSGVVDITTSLLISVVGYSQMVIVRLYYQQKVPIEFYEQHQMAYLFGIVLFVVGEFGNFYHHYIQTTWKRGQDKKYVVPHGGMFSLVACPHYLFEILAFWGLTFMSQDIIGVVGTLQIMGMLFGRAAATTKYYMKKLENYPASRFHIVPHLF